jgi:hypothetical protein
VCVRTVGDVKVPVVDTDASTPPDIATTPTMPDPDGEWTRHFVHALGVELWVEDDMTHGRGDAARRCSSRYRRPAPRDPRDDRRHGVRMRPAGPINPTVDLRATLLSRPPSTGTVFSRVAVKMGNSSVRRRARRPHRDPTQPFAHDRHLHEPSASRDGVHDARLRRPGCRRRCSTRFRPARPCRRRR